MDDKCPEPAWHDIITLLRLEAGRIMEDTSDAFASPLASDQRARRIQLRQACSASNDIQALLAAVQVLHRRCLLGGDQA